MEINPLLRTIDNTAIGVQRTWTHSLHLHIDQHTHNVKVNVDVDANVKCEQALGLVHTVRQRCRSCCRIRCHIEWGWNPFTCGTLWYHCRSHCHCLTVWTLTLDPMHCIFLPLPLPHRVNGPLKVHSNGAAAATAFFLCGWWQRQSKHECFTLPLSLPHRMGSKNIYLRHNCCSHSTVNESISYNVIQLLTFPLPLPHRVNGP